MYTSICICIFMYTYIYVYICIIDIHIHIYIYSQVYRLLSLTLHSHVDWCSWLHCNKMQHAIPHTVTHCNTLQHICNTLQHTVAREEMSSIHIKQTITCEHTLSLFDCTYSRTLSLAHACAQTCMQFQFLRHGSGLTFDAWIHTKKI